jgi:hypothetical protein
MNNNSPAATGFAAAKGNFTATRNGKKAVAVLFSLLK